MEFRDVGFCEGRETGELGEKLLVQGENQQQTRPESVAGRNPHLNLLFLDLGISETRSDLKREELVEVVVVAGYAVCGMQ